MGGAGKKNIQKKLKHSGKAEFSRLNWQDITDKMTELKTELKYTWDDYKVDTGEYNNNEARGN